MGFYLLKIDTLYYLFFLTFNIKMNKISLIAAKMVPGFIMEPLKVLLKGAKHVMIVILTFFFYSFKKK